MLLYLLLACVCVADRPGLEEGSSGIPRRERASAASTLQRRARGAGSQRILLPVPAGPRHTHTPAVNTAASHDLYNSVVCVSVDSMILEPGFGEVRGKVR